MSFTAFQALVRRDLLLFFQDRRAMTMSFVAPIVIGSFVGYLFNGVNDRPQSKIEVGVVDLDNGDISRRIATAIAADPAIEVRRRSLEEARAAVRNGKLSIAVVIPKSFGGAAVASLIGATIKPEVQLLYDPSRGAELQLVRGLLMQHIMQSVTGATFGGGVGSVQLPYKTHEEPMTARRGVKYNSMAHSFAGMCVQFILFMGIDAGLTVLLQRRTGIWKRLQAAPISRWTVIGSRSASAAMIAVLIMVVVFAFARAVFGVKIEGSYAGFALVCLAFGLMTAAFGLLVAVLGKTPEGSRGIAILVTLILVMLGGSWVPAFIFPQWLQNVSFAVPTRWAMDALDGLVWRGWTLQQALTPVGALLGFTAFFGAIAVWRFRWQTDQ